VTAAPNQTAPQPGQIWRTPYDAKILILRVTFVTNGVWSVSGVTYYPPTPSLVVEADELLTSEDPAWQFVREC